MTKKKVVFIGSFKSKSNSGHVGGQMFACNGLVNSSLSDKIDWIKIDTTASTNKARSFISRLWGAIKRYRKFRKALRENEVDAVLAFCSRGNSFLEKGYMLKIAKKRGIRTILAPRSGFLLDDIENNTDFANKVQVIFNSCDFIVCQGNFWKDYFDNNFVNTYSKTVVIHNWIDIVPVERRSKHHNGTLILFFGWIDSNKGVLDILEVARRLVNENITWILGGDGKDFELVQNRIVEYGLVDKVSLPGWILDMTKEDLLSKADIFILPSYREGLPNAMLEAMGNGIATIVSDVGAVSDIVEDNINGKLIESGNLNQIEQAVLNLHLDKDHRNLIARRGKATIENKNAIDLGIAKFKKILM